MFKVSDKEFKALQAICNAIIPSIKKEDDSDGYWNRQASDLQVPEKIIDLVGTMTVAEQEKFKNLLFLLTTPLLGFTWFGSFKSAHKLSLDQRTKLLQKWANHPLPKIRNGYSTLKKLSAYFYFAGSIGFGENPNWKNLGYQPLSNKNEISKQHIHPIQITKPTTLECDVVVVGSGASGSIVAAELAASGQKVIIVEKGPYLSPNLRTNKEEEMFNQLYEARAALQSIDGNIGILAGSCVGGGTTVNWAGAFRTPDFVLEEWAKEHDNPHFTDNDYKKCFEAIEKRTSVTTDLLRHNPQNQSLVDGAKKLGLNSKIIPRNIKNASQVDQETFWKAQGFSPLGDHLDSKQSALVTFLQDAINNGAELIADTKVERVTTNSGVATGVEATTKDVNGNPVSISIRANKVIVAAGAIHTPVILQKSGLEHPEIGRNLYLHPTSPVSGLYDHKVETWHGPMMTAVVDAFTKMDGNYGVKLETPPAHPGLMSTATNWTTGAAFKEEMLNLNRIGSFIVLTRDKFGGRITTDQQGRPSIKYIMSDYDKKHLIRGIQEGLRIQVAAGAKRIGFYHNQATFCHIDKDNVEQYIANIPNLKWDLNRFFLASAHQMGTCRMGGSNKRHPLKPTGETREIKNLYVADTSAFPSASGSNPMLSVQALSYYIAQGIKIEQKVMV